MITEDESQKENNIDAIFSGEEHMDSSFGGGSLEVQFRFRFKCRWEKLGNRDRSNKGEERMHVRHVGCFWCCETRAVTGQRGPGHLLGEWDREIEGAAEAQMQTSMCQGTVKGLLR